MSKPTAKPTKCREDWITYLRSNADMMQRLYEQDGDLLSIEEQIRLREIIGRQQAMVRDMKLRSAQVALD